MHLDVSFWNITSKVSQKIACESARFFEVTSSWWFCRHGVICRHRFLNESFRNVPQHYCTSLFQIVDMLFNFYVFQHLLGVSLREDWDIMKMCDNSQERNCMSLKLTWNLMRVYKNQCFQQPTKFTGTNFLCHKQKTKLLEWSLPSRFPS